MPKQKVTLSLDAEQLEELRSLVGARSLSAAVDVAVAAHLGRIRHLAAVDSWLADLDAEHGPVPDEVARWADGVVERWARAASTSSA